uniref:Uncharacterized protein n=1 Tax=Megaselia scalaris TaxID=36166 RepID=T1GC52_MEGSC
MDNLLNLGVSNYLKQIKNTSKLDQEYLCLGVYKHARHPNPSIADLNFDQPLRNNLVRNQFLQKLHSEITTFENCTIIAPSSRQKSPVFRQSPVNKSMCPSPLFGAVDFN